MPKKKQYVTPGRYHYDVFRRDAWSEDNIAIKYVCSTSREADAIDIARALASDHRWSNCNRSYVVRARPTEAHNTLKFYCDEMLEDELAWEQYSKGEAEDDFANAVIKASVNGNGKASPTVVKAVEKALKA